MPFELRSFSRFRNTMPIRWLGNDTFGVWKRPSVFDQIEPQDIIKYAVTNDFEGRPDLIAEEFYYSSRYDWILVMFNQPLNPLGWPGTGQIIDIPVRSVITELL